MDKQYFFQEFLKVTLDCFNKGWNERNGGNISYRLSKEEVENVKHLFKSRDKYPLPIKLDKMIGEYFLISGTGKYFRNITLNPSENIGIIKILEDGLSYEIVWGLENSRPTSEIASHLLNHEKMDSEYNLILHAHPTNIITMSFIYDKDDIQLTKQLWRMMSECLIVFPKGIHTIDWKVPGTSEIGELTSNVINDYDLIVWKHHGCFVKAKSFDEAFGLIDTVEKACEIYLKVLSSNQEMTSYITDEQLKQLAKAFNVDVERRYFDDPK